jgi:hypothetical protein
MLIMDGWGARYDVLWHIFTIRADGTNISDARGTSAGCRLWHWHVISPILERTARTCRDRVHCHCRWRCQHDKEFREEWDDIQDHLFCEGDTLYDEGTRLTEVLLFEVATSFDEDTSGASWCRV